jgi:chemotaxis protein methyltransferase CheR
MFQRAAADGAGELKFWSVGCASGEEPYTLALILRESFTEQIKRQKVSILATDVDEDILEKARVGLYGDERLLEVPRAILQHWFSLHDSKHCLDPEIRAMVDFRQGDLFDVGSYPAADLVLCRNVLIYFERSEQEKILSGFADALGKGGVLVLGKAETLVGEARRRFEVICPVERIYRVQ